MKTILISLILGVLSGYLYGAYNYDTTGKQIITEYERYERLGYWEGTAICLRK